MTWRRHRRDDHRPRPRRSGPVDEVPWWDPVDQARAERPLLRGRDFNRGWIEASMPNNRERLDPLGDDPDSAVVRQARSERRMTGLDEGRAWRQRTHGSLAVLRVEVFADPDAGSHRRAWRDHAVASLEATWRARWRERELVPGWIEARWIDPTTIPAGPSPPVGEAVDWLRIEDHTDPSGAGRVMLYQHLMLWAGRTSATLTVRHDLGLDLDPTCAGAAIRLHSGLTTD